MNKPDWSDAPSWANYLAMDSDGAWGWYEHEPIIEYKDHWSPVGKWSTCEEKNDCWKGTLEKRP